MLMMHWIHQNPRVMQVCSSNVFFFVFFFFFFFFFFFQGLVAFFSFFFQELHCVSTESQTERKIMIDPVVLILHLLAPPALPCCWEDLTSQAST